MSVLSRIYSFLYWWGGGVMDRVKDLSGSGSESAVSWALRAHLQREWGWDWNKSALNVTILFTHTLSNSLSNKYSKSNVYLHNSACVFPFFSHNRCYNSTTKRVSWLPEGPVFVCFLYLLSHLTQWMIDWQLSLDKWLKGKATRSTSSSR